jgi:hypothetical protein
MQNKSTKHYIDDLRTHDRTLSTTITITLSSIDREEIEFEIFVETKSKLSAYNIC